MGWTDRLGPRWTREEVRRFFHLFREHQVSMHSSADETIAAMAAQLPTRTPDMIRALVQTHKGFLSLPMATDEGLFAILTDHYNAQLEWEREAKSKDPAPRVHPRKPKQRRFRSNERKHFVAAIDDAFFEHSEFQDCLAQMGMAHVQQAKRTEWSAIRLSMGHPRRFSATFLNEERQKLYRYRNVVRYAQRTKVRTSLLEGTSTNLQEFPSDIRFPYKIFHPLAIGTQVRVLHRNKFTNQLCVGRICSISTMDHSYEVIVAYTDHKEILNCPDTSVMLVDRAAGEPALLYWQQQQAPSQCPPPQLPLSHPRPPQLPLLQPSRPTPRPLPRPEQGAVRDAASPAAATTKRTFAAMRAVAALLQRKEMLLTTLARLNDRAEGLVAESSGPTLAQFQAQYAWVIVNLDTTNDVLAAALHRLQAVQHPPESLLLAPQGLEMHESTLNPQQIAWAHQFLTTAHDKSRALVANAVARLSSDERVRAAMPMPPKTTDVVTGCMDLVLTLQCAATSKNDHRLSPVVLHKLLDRNLEQIVPRSHANMSLYREICQSVEVLKSVLMHPTP
ncbi:ALWAYS EARLY 3-like [Achlya hypogyna]|uniref:ALWAYS EARLY 3-like n=1 Tax=Achlya hypogyna TaxID=1202772 RepID=A0A1V9YM94_ACHHY|nr:ALWAYS EARLY 3-like [Achlya hypogyna]